jgi:hypothetical protein
MDAAKWTAFNIVFNQFLETKDRKQLFEDMEDLFDRERGGPDE